MAKSEEIKEKQNVETATMEEIQKMREELEKEKAALEQEKQEVEKEKQNVETALSKQKEVLVSTKEDMEKDINEAKKTADILKKNVVKTKVPVDPNNPKDLYIPVTINGYTWTIKRGETVEIPEAVAKILEEAKYI